MTAGIGEFYFSEIYKPFGLIIQMAIFLLVFGVIHEPNEVKIKDNWKKRFFYIILLRRCCKGAGLNEAIKYI